MTSVSLDRIANALGMTEGKTPDTHIWATVSSINEDGSYQVKMNGAQPNETTRAAKVCNAEVGDRVLCVVANGQVSAIGKVGGVTLEELGGLGVEAQGTSGIWSYLKFSDGTAICYGKYDATLSHYASAGGLYGYTASVSFPFSFVQPATVTCSAFIGNGFACTGTVTGSGPLSGAAVYALASSSGSQSTSWYINAIGRWK